MKQVLKKHPIMLLAAGLIVAVSGYWGLVASDRYVSEANIVLESPQITSTSFDFSSFISGTGGTSSDLLLLKDYMLSVDMLKLLDTELNLRAHYSNTSIDLFSRLWSIEDPLEEFHEYYKRRIHVTLDDYANVLRIKVQAFEPEMAHAIATLLLKAGETHMNKMGQRLAAEQVRFIETQLERLGQRFDKARNNLLDYQNRFGLVSPTGTVETITAVVATLEGELARLKARKTALSNFHGPNSPEMVRLNNEIEALRNQITEESSRMAQKSGDALNELSSEYQSLELRAKFAQETFTTALSALESTKIEAARKLKQVSVLQSPTLPEYPVEPERLYNSTVFALITIFLSLIFNMLRLIVKDHMD